MSAISLPALYLYSIIGLDDVAAVNFEMKVLDPGSNFVFHVATGATA